MAEEKKLPPPNECKLCPKGTIHKIPHDVVTEHQTSHQMEGHSKPIKGCILCL